MLDACRVLLAWGYTGKAKFFREDGMEAMTWDIEAGAKLSVKEAGSGPRFVKHVPSEASTLPATQSAIRLISEAAASLDLIIEKKVGAAWQAAPDHDVAILLADQPNDWTSTFGLIRDLVATALTVDKGAVAFVNRVSGKVSEIVRYEPGHYTIDLSTDGRQEPNFRINNVPMDADSIIHLRGTFSRSPLSLARDAINAAKHMERHAGNLFKNAARPGGVLESPKAIGDEGVKKMIKGWQKSQGGSENAGSTPILWDGTKFVQMTMNSTDAQFLENRKYQTLEICRAFRVPPSMIYELDRATWSNGEQQGKEFLTFSLDPWLKALEAALRRALFTPEERKDFRVRFDRDDLNGGTSIAAGAVLIKGHPRHSPVD